MPKRRRCPKSILWLLVLATAMACRSQKRGTENLKRGQDMLATQPSAAILEYDRAELAGADSLEVKKGKAAAHERLKEYDKATQLLKAVLERKPDDFDARLALARVELVQRHFDEARAALEPTLRDKLPSVPALLVYAAIAQTPEHGRTGTEALEHLDQERFAAVRKSAEYAFALANLKSASGDVTGAQSVLNSASKSKSVGSDIAVTLANIARLMNRAWFAEWLLERASDSEGATEEVQRTLAEVALSLRHPALARTAIAKLRTEIKPDPNALLLLAEYYDLQHQPRERAQATRRALDAVPTENDAERRKVAISHAIALAKAGNANDASAVLTGLLEEDANQPIATLLLADLRLGQKQFDDAIGLATKLEKDEQLRTEAFRILVSAHLQKQASAAAEAAARRFVATSGACPDSVMLLTNLLVHLNRHDQALREVEAGLARYPKLGELLAARISLTERVKGFEKAEALAQEAVRSKHPRAARELAGLYERNKRDGDAVAIYRDLAKTEPRALLDLSLLQERMGKLEEALASIRQLAEAEPYNANALARVGSLEGVLGRGEPARQAFERVLSIDPESILALNNLSMLLAETRGETQRAVELARRAYALAGADVRVGDTLGWALVMHGNDSDRGEALQLLGRAADAMHSSEVDYHYGAALAAAGRTAEAKVVLERALRPTGEFPWRAKAERLRDEMSSH